MTPGGKALSMARGGAISTLSIAAIIAVVALASIMTPLMFLNYREVNITQVETLPLEEGVKNLDLTVTATVGKLNVTFADLDDASVQINALVQGKASFFGDSPPFKLNVAYGSNAQAGGSNMTARIGFDTYAPWPYYSMSLVQYTVVIDESLRTKLNLSMTTGGIVLDTHEGVVLDELRLNSTVDGAKVSFNNGTTLAGDVHIKTATGGTLLYWNNVSVRGPVSVTLTESSGFVRAYFDQVVPMGGEVSVLCLDTVGEVRMSFDVAGPVSAGATCEWSIGEPKVVNLGGFGGDAERFCSDNHPSPDRFDAQLNNTVGNVLMEGRWTP
jgi:hypothetical protein